MCRGPAWLPFPTFTTWCSSPATGSGPKSPAPSSGSLPPPGRRSRGSSTRPGWPRAGHPLLADQTIEAIRLHRVALKGQGIANPLALLMSGVIMLNHLAETRGDPRCRNAAERIKAAYNRALADGQKTRDLGGTLGTDEFAEAVVQRLPGADG